MKSFAPLPRQLNIPRMHGIQFCLSGLAQLWVGFRVLGSELKALLACKACRTANRDGKSKFIYYNPATPMLKATQYIYCTPHLAERGPASAV